MKGNRRQIAMRQVREHSPVGQGCSQRGGMRRASFLAGLVAAGITLLTAATGFAQVQNSAGPAGGRAGALPPVNYPIDEFGTGQVGTTPMTPASQTGGKSEKACCTPGKDCPCTAGKDCACTPGVNCPCQRNRRHQRKGQQCLKNQNRQNRYFSHEIARQAATDRTTAPRRRTLAQSLRGPPRRPEPPPASPG